jgi:hypothetical protein
MPEKNYFCAFLYDMNVATKWAMPFCLFCGAAPKDEFASRLKELFSLLPVEIINENG